MLKLAERLVFLAAALQRFPKMAGLFNLATTGRRILGAMRPAASAEQIANLVARTTKTIGSGGSVLEHIREARMLGPQAERAVHPLLRGYTPMGLAGTTSATTVGKVAAAPPEEYGLTVPDSADALARVWPSLTARMRVPRPEGVENLTAGASAPATTKVKPGF